MRKQIINKESQDASQADQGWLDLQQLAQVELTSEDADHPIEAALVSNNGSGWRAAQGGEQTIRFSFDTPIRLSRIRLVFNEEHHVRTQEFVLQWLSEGMQHYQQLVRQQYNFSPPTSMQEVEEYTVNLDRVTALELRIVPDISGGEIHATLAQMRLA